MRNIKILTKRGKGIVMNNRLIKDVVRRKETGITLAAVILFLVFTISSESFLTAYNIFNISRTLALYIFIALSQVMTLVVGGLNLSVGAIGGLATITTGYLIDVSGVPGWLAVLCAIFVGLAMGAINGVVITKLGINAFIVTLSTLFIYTGLVFGISKGYSYKNIPKAFTIVGRRGMFGLPYLFWLMLLALIIIFYLFRYTVFGRRLLATGGNIDAARLSGINTDRIILAANTLSGFFAALAGILSVSRMGSAQPATGQNWLIISFAVAIIGGTALQGGIVTAWGLLMGGIVMVLIKNGLILLEANIYYEQAFLGGIILLAVAIDRVRELYSERAKL